MIVRRSRFVALGGSRRRDRKSTRLNSSHSQISYAVFCLKKKKNNPTLTRALFISFTNQFIYFNLHTALDAYPKSFDCFILFWSSYILTTLPTTYDVTRYV